MSSLYTLPQPSACQFIRTFPDHHLWASFWNFRLSHIEISHAPVQVTNLKGTLIVNLYEFSQTFRETFSAPLTEVCHDVLCEAVFIFLLVRQQFQRMDQISAQALRYCMSFEDLGLIDTFTCLYDQKPVWLLSIVFLHTSRTTNALFPRDPPDAVFQRETAAVRTQVGHRDSSLSSNWRDDAPQVVRASAHDFWHNAQLSSLVLCHLLKGFFYSVKRPFRGLYFTLKMLLYSSQFQHFSGR